MISVIELKRHMAGISIFNIIIGKFRYKKKLCLVILFQIDKNSKVSFYYTILPFDLTVCLWVKGGKQFPFDPKEIA